MKRLYKLLSQLYPRKFRETFGEEMARVFEEAAHERRNQGPIAYAGFVLRETLGLLFGAVGAWLGGQPARPMEAAGASGPPADLVEAQRRVDASIAGMVHAIANHQFERARFYSLAERELRVKLQRLKELYGLTE